MGLKSQELRTQDLTSIPPSSRGNSSTLTPAPSEDSPGPGLSLPRRPSNAGQGRTEGQTDTDRQGFATVGAPAQAAARARVQTAPVPPGTPPLPHHPDVGRPVPLWSPRSSRAIGPHGHWLLPETDGWLPTDRQVAPTDRQVASHQPQPQVEPGGKGCISQIFPPQTALTASCRRLCSPGSRPFRSSLGFQAAIHLGRQG